MISLPQAAQMWNTAGVSTIPILPNGTKRPVVQWAEYQARIPTLGELDRWWGNGHEYGLAVICGAVSGNLEMTELEGKVALNSDLMVALDREFFNRNLTWLWEGLRQTYSEWTPSGGIHLIYRISDAPVPGNEKIAVDSDGKVRAETRGEGGYVIVAPTSGLCHPSGESWMLLGESIPGQVPVLSWEERNLLHDVLRHVLHQEPEPPAPSRDLVPTSPGTSLVEGAGARPGDQWSDRVTWSEILEPNGWTLSHTRGEEEFWTRPGKSRRDGHSATVNYAGSGLLKVFSSSVPELVPDATYTKFGALAAIQFRGDHAAAAKWLSRQGFGTGGLAPRANNPEKEDIEEDNYYTLDDVGNGQRMMNEQSWSHPDYLISHVHRFVDEERHPRFWDGQCWVQNDNAIMWETDAVTRTMMRSDDEGVSKCGARSRSLPKQKAMASLFFAQPGMSLKADRFDADSRYLNLRNGVYDLHEGRLHPHHPSFLVTQQVNASYDPDAKALRWEQFLAEALPDEGLRKYVQRCLGYTLLGNPSERAMFVVYGPSGTGKSTFLETINAVLGSYGETAPAGTFRTSRNTDDTAPTPALHQLRGKRFVTTSETSEGVQWNEELVKRYTGRDLMRSRGLYESYQTWRNEASIWLATNHAPRFTSDDLAIWKRVKLIPFETVFLGEDQILAMDEILIQEADGILNWLLEGLAAYNDLGLDEPAMVTESVQRLREQSDSVVRFLNDRIDEGMLEASPGTSTSMVVLLGLYTQWCRDAGERPVGGRRFRTRLETTGRDISVTPDGRIVLGVRRPLGGWLAQT